LIKLAANLTTMFQEYDSLDERCRMAAACGFKAVEILNPYDHTPLALSDYLTAAGLQMILLNIQPGLAGETGTAALTGRQDDFALAMDTALEYANTIGVDMIHVLAGRSTDLVDTSERCFVDNLKWAADKAAKADITLNLEPLNTFDVPGYLHSRVDETAELIEKIGQPNVRIQFDVYHLQKMQGNLVDLFHEYQELISHVQFSSVPGRHEPEYGEVNTHFVLNALEQCGYTGWIGCEYWPKDGTLDGLKWAEAYGISAGTSPI
jgi:hydroxypyruvate isomerase